MVIIYKFSTDVGGSLHVFVPPAAVSDTAVDVARVSLVCALDENFNRNTQ